MLTPLGPEMGRYGPIPKRASQRRRTPDAGTAKITTAPGAAEVTVPTADPSWHRVAREWFDSLGESGQSVYYEPSDYAVAFIIAESMSRELKPQPILVGGRISMRKVPPKAASITAWLHAMTGLLATEGDRRRVRLELERPTGSDDGPLGDVAHLEDIRARLRGPQSPPPNNPPTQGNAS
jgi:hypothetical protein